MKEFSFELTTVREVLSSLDQVLTLVKNDLERRFANVGITQFAYVLEPNWTEPATDGAEALTSARAMLSWSEHFDVDAALLQQQWQHLHACRMAYLKSHPNTSILPMQLFWAPLL
eukprot:7132463-Karenia_brevis.AAC.1